jgi:enoyl-CoA hydratase/carnithine racemase
MERHETVVARSHDGAVHTITLPGGPLTARAAAELVAAADEIVEDRDVRMVVVTAGGDFCTGPAADLDPLTLRPDPAAALARLRPLVVAAVDGGCHSVGLEIALATDVRIATPSASFSLGDVCELGRLPCWGGTQRLPRVMGVAGATAVLLLGRTLDATAARAAGLVHDLSPDLPAAVGELADQVLGVGPLAVELAKEAVHRGAELPLRDGLRLEGDLNTLLQSTTDRAEGLAAFFAKRPPDFAGR